MKKTLSLVAILGLGTVILTGCNSKNVWDVDYDLSTEMGRQLHCYAQFQKDVRAKNYGAEWANEVIEEGYYTVEGKVIADGVEFELSCSYPEEDVNNNWIVSYSPVASNPASEYCIANGGTFDVVSNETGMYGECILPDGTKCEEWAYYNGECGAENNEEIQTSEFDLETEEGRVTACMGKISNNRGIDKNRLAFILEDESKIIFYRDEYAAYECFIDMENESVVVNELQEDTEVVEE